MMEIVDRITTLLEEQQISAAKMCRDLGFSSGLYSQWKKKTQKPSTAKLQKIADYLAVSVDTLLGREVENEDEMSDVRFALYRETANLSDDTLMRILDFARYAKVQEKKKANSEK